MTENKTQVGMPRIRVVVAGVALALIAAVLMPFGTPRAQAAQCGGSINDWVDDGLLGVLSSTTTYAGKLYDSNVPNDQPNLEIDAMIELKTDSLITDPSATITLTRPNQAPRTLSATYRIHHGNRLLVASSGYGLLMLGQCSDGGAEVTRPTSISVNKGEYHNYGKTPWSRS